MVLQTLISLGESMMVHVTGLVVAVATKVRLGTLGLLNLDVDALDLTNVSRAVTYLIILHAHLDGELVRHDESIGLNAVEVVLLLLLLLALVHLLLLLLHLSLHHHLLLLLHLGLSCRVHHTWLHHVGVHLLLHGLLHHLLLRLVLCNHLGSTVHVLRRLLLLLLFSRGLLRDLFGLSFLLLGGDFFGLISHVDLNC